MNVVSKNSQNANTEGPKVYLPIPNLYYDTKSEIITLKNGKYPATCPHQGALHSVAGHGEQETNIVQAKKTNTIQTQHSYQTCSSLCALFKVTKNKNQPTLEVQLGCSHIRHPNVQMFVDGSNIADETK